MTKRYKILCSDELNTTYTFIKEELPSLTLYSLILDESNELLFTAENYGNGIKFEKKLGKDFDYSEIADLTLFLNLIQKFDAISDEFEVYEKIATL